MNQSYTKKRTTWSMFSGLALFMVASIYLASVLLWPLRPILPEVVDYPKRVPANAQAQWPTAYAALGTVDQGLLAQTSDTQVPIASITKIVTTLVILDAKPLQQGQVGPTITLTAADVARYNQYISADGSVGPATVGMQITQYQLLQGMLLSSANNYADTAAIWAYGSMDAYLTAAQAYLKKHNLQHTTVADATGFSAQSVSTPRDLVKLGIMAVQQPIISGITSQKTATLPGIGIFSNTNKLVGTHGVIGLKTGTTDEAGKCLLFATQFSNNNQPVTLVGVVLGEPTHEALFSHVSSLVDQTAVQFSERSIIKPNSVFARYSTPWGSSTNAVGEYSAFGWSGSAISIETDLSPIVPGSSSKPGIIHITNGTKTTDHSLKLVHPLEPPSAWWRITHPRYVFDL